ncbi:hypothetical protein JTE90_015376 [Oedothorax gibbosus]|uniref:Cytochrome P450 n=1 Tax=Oedothorax gibbosus TaxID=931172 RepID=A0AAV6U4S1_9ARAC|nr:hypothetical protein JTE90_015376 [Oedothorax gibbosus]
MPFIGKYDINRQHLATRDKRQRLGSDIMREDFGPFEAVLCFLAEDLQEILKNEGTYPSRMEFSSLKAYRELRKEWYTTHGLLVEQGKKWQDLRHKTQKHLMKPAAIQAYLEPMQEVARDFIKRMNDIKDSNNEVPNLLHELYKWALESVSFVGLDTRLGCLESNLTSDSDGLKMVESVLTQFECMNKLEPFSGKPQIWKLFSTPTWRKFVKASDVHTKISFKYINRALDDMKLNEGNENKQLTLLQAMLAKGDLDVSHAMVFVADMLMAGVETTSHTVAFMLYHLARNPDKQERLFKEIIELLPDKDLKITKTNFEKLYYLKACVKEALRLNPIIGGTARMLANDTVLCGHQVPAGTFAFVPYEEIFQDERYFKNANTFVPERWLSREKPHPFACIPFSFGPRGCIGRRLAELEIICLVTEIIRRYKVEYHFEDIGVYTKMVNTPDKPLRFNFTERQ